MNTVFAVALLSALPFASAVLCRECEGWHGKYPPGSDKANPCHNPNNQCGDSMWCVKRVDPISKARFDYVTYKADCWSKEYIRVNATDPDSEVKIQNGRCYTVHDGSKPQKKHNYCFCNDKAHCNSSPIVSLTPLLAALIGYML